MAVTGSRMLWYTLSPTRAARLSKPVDPGQMYDALPPGTLEWSPGVGLVFTFLVLRDDNGDRYLARIAMAPVVTTEASMDEWVPGDVPFEYFLPLLVQDLGFRHPKQKEALRRFLENPLIYQDSSMMMLSAIEPIASEHLGEPSALAQTYNEGLQKEEVLDLRFLDVVPPMTPLDLDAGERWAAGENAMTRFIREHDIHITSKRVGGGKKKGEIQWEVTVYVGSTERSVQVEITTPPQSKKWRPSAELVLMDIGFEVSLHHNTEGDYEAWAELRRSLHPAMGPIKLPTSRSAHSRTLDEAAGICWALSDEEADEGFEEAGASIGLDPGVGAAMAAQMKFLRAWQASMTAFQASRRNR